MKRRLIVAAFALTFAIAAGAGSAAEPNKSDLLEQMARQKFGAKNPTGQEAIDAALIGEEDAGSRHPEAAQGAP